MDEATLEYYEKNAAVIAPGYEAASAGVSALFPFVFKPGQRVLDIGAGSGRDMARLLSLGIDAYGIEPSDSMRHQAAAAPPDLKTRLLAGHVPGGLPATRWDEPGAEYALPIRSRVGSPLSFERDWPWAGSCWSRCLRAGPM